MIFKRVWLLFLLTVSIEGSNKILEKNVYRFKPMVCRTDDCKTMADVILSTMNSSANPCEDFYEYTCGAWIHSNETIPPNEPMWNRMKMFNKKLSEKLRTILESRNIEELPVEKAKKWYRSCMDEGTLEDRGIEPLTSIATAVGGWPISMALGQWNPSDYSWQEIELYYSRIAGSYAMYKLAIIPNVYNKSLNEISLTAPSLPLSKILPVKREFFDLEDRESYGNLIAGVAKAFSMTQKIRPSDEKIAKEVNDMIEFEIQLNQIRDSDTIARSNISLVQEFLDQQIPDSPVAKINVLKLTKNMFEGIEGIEITKNEMISVEARYFTDLCVLLNKTSFRTIVNYVHWHYISRLFHATNSRMKNLLLEFTKGTLGIELASPRWEECVNQMELKHALSYRFVSEHFTEGTYNSGLKMLLKIQMELEKQMNESTWTDEATKELLRDKLRNVKTFVGFPDWYKNVTKLEEYYEDLMIDDDYFNNVLHNMRFEKKKELQTLRTTDAKPEWLSDPITINAYYIVQSNSLNIPAADFQSPVFTPTMPEAVKYGIIGSILGHELSHGFDDTGCHYDKNGEMMDWPDDMMNAYWERTRCFIDQYDNLTRENSTEKIFYGSNTVGENIADTMGVITALRAYKLVVEESVKGDRKLPKLGDFTNEQLFFLSYATIWCEMATPQYQRKRLISGDAHSLPRVRALAAMSNTEAFARAFNCPEGSPMNPAVKCNIWTG